MSSKLQPVAMLCPPLQLLEQLLQVAHAPVVVGVQHWRVLHG